MVLLTFGVASCVGVSRIWQAGWLLVHAILDHGMGSGTGMGIGIGTGVGIARSRWKCLEPQPSRTIDERENDLLVSKHTGTRVPVRQSEKLRKMKGRREKTGKKREDQIHSVASHFILQERNGSPVVTSAGWWCSPDCPRGFSTTAAGTTIPLRRRVASIHS